MWCVAYLSFNWSSVPGAGCTMNCNDDISCYPNKMVRRRTSTPSVEPTLGRRQENENICRLNAMQYNNGHSAGENMTKHSRHTRSMEEICYRHFWWWWWEGNAEQRCSVSGGDTDNNHADSSWSSMVTTITKCYSFGTTFSRLQYSVQHQHFSSVQS